MNDLIIVTGGAGFIGSNVVRAFNRRGISEILVVDHLNHPKKEQNLKSLKYIDFLDKTDFRRKLQTLAVPTAQGVIHLGACSSTTETNAGYLEENNFLYTKELCEWSLGKGARFVYASSAATYGDGSKGYDDDEDSIPNLEPLNLYGMSKQKFDLWALDTGVARSIAGIKYFNVFGPGEDHKGEMRSLVNKAYRQIVEEGSIRLFKSHRPDYRDGEQKRDFVYVEDAVAVTLYFFDNRQISGIFNCGTGRARTWIDLAKSLFTAMNRPPQIEFIEMPESIRDKYQYFTEARVSKLRSSGYVKPFQSIEQGVEKYVRDYLTQLKD